MNRFFSLLVVFVFCSVSAVAQSPRKVNKELKQSVVAASARYDSLKTAFSKEKSELENQRLAIRNESVKELDEAYTQFIQNRAKIWKITEKLTELGEEPWALINRDELYKTLPVHFSLAKPAVPLFYDSHIFNEIIPKPITEEMSLEQQNELLTAVLYNYSYTDSVNRGTLLRITNCRKGLDVLDTKLDSCVIDLHARNQQFDEGWNILYSKYEELRAEYERDLEKGKSIHLIDEFGGKGTDFENVPIPPVTSFNEMIRDAKFQSEQPVIYETIEQLAEFPGGMGALKEYIKVNLVLPEKVTSGVISGKCYVKFVISGETGNVSNVKIMKGVPDCTECDEAASALVKGMPNWIPSKNNGKPVNSFFTLPIVFKAE